MDKQPPNIHMLINFHAGERLDTELHNALHLLRLRLKNGDSPAKALIADAWSQSNTPRRAAMFIRWRRKLIESRRTT